MKERLDDYRYKIKDLINGLSKTDKKVLDDYIRFRRTKASDDKCNHYQTKIVILRDVSDIPFDKFDDKEFIQELLILIKNSDRELTERNELRKVLKNFLKWKFNNAELLDAIALEKQPKVNKRKIYKNTLPTDEEVAILFKGCKNLKEKCMLTIQEELGLRPNELLNLKWKNIKFYDDHADVTITSTKNGVTRILPFVTGLVHLLRWKNEFKYPDRREDDYLFPSKIREKPHYRVYLSMLYRRICVASDIRILNPYLLRHRRCTQVYQKTKDLKLTAKFGGHSIEIAESVYQQFDEEDIKDFLMEKVYGVTEPDIQTKNKMQKEIDDLKEKVKDIENIKLILKNLDAHKKALDIVKAEEQEKVEEFLKPI